MVIFDKRPFSFIDWNGDWRLVVLVSSEDLTLLGRDERTLRNDFSHHSSYSLNSQSQRSSINNHQFIFSLFSTDDSSLNSSSISHSFIRVYSSVRFLLVKEVLHQLPDFRNSSRSSHQYDFINLVLLQLRVFQSLLNRTHGLSEQVIIQLFEFGSSKYFTHVMSFM